MTKQVNTYTSYAVPSEKDDGARTIFQRDKDRIIHSKAFRRLSGKTQVFVATYGDHFRDRLTHSLEVAQVARDLCRRLSLNEDLAETVALAHDLGHPPFGHAGEYTLNAIMQGFGLRFEHNEQSKRIVEQLEKQFPDFEGLNLSYEVRQGLAKHQTYYDQKGKKISGKTLEAQVVDLADEIAYHNHDLDDGLRSSLFTFKDLGALSLWKKASAQVFKKYGIIKNSMVLRHRTVSQLISLMIEDVAVNTQKELKRKKIKTLKQVLLQKNNIVGFSPKFSKEVIALRKFLWKYMYHSRQVLSHSERGQKILKKIFWYLYKNPKKMPRHFYGKIGKPDPLEVVVKDYVAGCTDAFATALYKKI